MRTTLALAACLCLPLLSDAQRGFRKIKKPYAWDIGFHQGAANYLGEMGGKDLTRRDFVSDMKLSQTRYYSGIFARYKTGQYWSVKGELDYIRIAGADSLSTNAARNARNLSFRNDMVELNGQALFHFYEVNDLGGSYLNRNYFRAYVGAGIGAVYHNPKTLYNGEWVALRPLTTEGQEKPYSRVTAVVPISGGMYVTLNKKCRLGWDITWRTAFTDYLDDVSTTYADDSQLPNATAIALSNRTDEKNDLTPAFANNFTPGSKRGDATHNDSYLTTSFEMSYVLSGRSDWRKWIDKKPGNKGIRNPIFGPGRPQVIRPPKW